MDTQERDESSCYMKLFLMQLIKITLNAVN